MNIKTEYIPICRTAKCALRTVFIIIPTLVYCDDEIVESFHAIWNLISWPITKFSPSSQQPILYLAIFSHFSPARKFSVDFWHQSWLKPSHFRIIRVVYINSNSGWNSDCSYRVFLGIPQSCRRLSECNTETEANSPATFTFLKCEQPSIQYDTSDAASLSLRFIVQFLY